MSALGILKRAAVGNFYLSADGSFENERRAFIHDHVAGDAAGEDEGAGLDCGRAGVGMAAEEGERAGAGFREASGDPIGLANRAVEGGVGVVAADGEIDGGSGDFVGG